MILKDSAIYIAGHCGLIGSAVTQRFQMAGYTNLICRTHDELDLTDQDAVNNFFEESRPEYVIMNAAVPANSINVKSNPAKLMLDNIAMIQNVFSACISTSIKKLLYVCSIACYPSDVKTITLANGERGLHEDMLQPGKIKKVSERYYAMPKLLGLELSRLLNDKSIVRCVTLVIPHAYGINYHYNDPSRLPVYPSLIKRFCDAVKNRSPEVVIWGSGGLRREFTYVDDLAEGYLLLLESEDAEGIYNIGAGQFISIREAAETMKRVTRYPGEIVYDRTKPDGMEFPMLCTDRLRALGWQPVMKFEEGVRKACEYYTKMWG